LKLEVLKCEIADKDYDLTAKTLGLCAVLEVLFRKLEDEKQSFKEDCTAFNGLLSLHNSSVEYNVQSLEDVQQDTDFEVRKILLPVKILLLPFFPLIDDLDHTHSQHLNSALEVGAHCFRQTVRALLRRVNGALAFPLAGKTDNQVVELESKQKKLRAGRVVLL
jgi:hypothetical protein